MPLNPEAGGGRHGGWRRAGSCPWRLIAAAIACVSLVVVAGPAAHATSSTASVSSCAIEESFGVDFTAASASSPKNLWVAAEGSEPVAGMLGHWNGRSWRWWCDSDLNHVGLAAIAAVSPSQAWSVGGGTLDRWSGSVWQTISTPVTAAIQPETISAPGKDDVWIAGHGVAQWNGHTWRMMLQNPGGGGGGFDDVSASGPDNTWAVWSSSGNSPRTALYHWNGRRWYKSSWGSGPLKRLGALVSVSAASPTDVWVAGNGVERWNGKIWQRRPSPSMIGGGMGIVSINASVKSGTWVMGGGQSHGGDVGNPTQIEHWNGNRWVRRGSPVTYWYGQPALAVDQSSKTVWAAGLYAIKSWDGTGWHSVGASLPGVYQGNLDAVTHVSNSEFWMVGSYARSTNGKPYGLIERWDGMHGVVTPTALPNTPTTFASVSGTSPDDVWAVGDKGVPGITSTTAVVQHWNGSKWTLVPNPVALQKTSGVTAVSALAVDDVWAAAWGSTSGYVFEHWNGAKWTLVPGARVAAPFINGLTAISKDDVWAVGQYDDNVPLIEHWNGRQWSMVPAHDTENNGGAWLSTLAALGKNNIWAGGCNEYGTNVNDFLDHWNGRTWSLAPGAGQLGDGCVVDITAISARNLWGIASVVNPYPSRIEHWNGNMWSEAPSPFISGSKMLTAISGSASNDVWALGSDCCANEPGPLPNPTPIPIEHWNGRSWQLVLGPVATIAP